ncbi:ABC transporter permease [Ferrovibrio sp.]|uniref:ABC transporter permease n=1 Tax=Ferrovibrio sp. TaxID=1917215 RepID=UPI0025BAF6FE|nr:ABC transporter permease [Ferrovibrio sp.]MBX3454635.1 ABC transporter permease [Ferrovibrio sp.]
MITDILVKIANAALLLLAVVVLNFCLIHAAPGDPAQVIAGEMGGASQEVLDQIRRLYDLDKPMLHQLAIYIGKVLQGDFGHSFYFNESVTKLILQRLPATVILVLAALSLAVLAGTFLGVLSARKPNGLLNHFVTFFSLAGYAAPVFWTGLMLILLFASAIPLFPISGMADVARPKQGAAYILDVLHHLVLPALTLAIVYMAQYSRLSRTSMIDALRADYIRTARAKGLSERTVVFKHALRNALIPVVTMVGLQFGHLFAGAVLVETVFGWPGLGRLVFESILRRDYPTLLGVLFFSALLVMLANIATDIAYRLVDPRIRLRR